MIASLRTGSKFYLFWFAAGFLSLLLAAISYFQWWTRFPKSVRYGILGICAMGMLSFLVVEGCILSQFGKKGRPGMKYLIVLGAQVYETRPSLVLRYRLDAALDYLNENPETICIVSGGQGQNEPRPEADVMAEYLEAHGIAASRILRERKSETTDQNISFSRKLMKDESSVAVVTNNFHLFRACQIARNSGLEEIEGISAPSSPAYLPNNMIREFFAEVKYLMKSHRHA
jgi:uncharacterized SAM-binding protein YcdF (DUF218 family)